MTHKKNICTRCGGDHPSINALCFDCYRREIRIIGWFMVAFQADVDHEYPFMLLEDGRILPEIANEWDDMAGVFVKYINDPTFHHARFIKNAN